MSKELSKHCLVTGCIALCAEDSYYCTVHRFRERIDLALGVDRKQEQQRRRPVIERDADGLPVRMWL